MATKRMLQLAEQIREFVALLFAQGRLSDPRLKGITINSVRLSPDLEHAKVYFSLFPSDEAAKKTAIEGLKQASGFIRHELGKTLEIRFTPKIMFYYDDSVEHASKINSLIENIKKESPSE